MDRDKLGATADRLFMQFMAPLVLGGEMYPGRFIGGAAALELGAHQAVLDPDRLAHVALARVRVARRLAPVDRLEPPHHLEWALSACLHDIVQSTHPSLTGVFRGKVPLRLLDIVERTVERIAPPAHAMEALSRHTWFSRLFEVARTDTQVSWWTGSATFLGTTPPARLTAWSSLRRVHVNASPRPLAELTGTAPAADPPRFLGALRRFLTRTPLTDLATCTRTAPAFVWSEQALALVASRSARTLVLRAVRQLPEEASSAALGRATRLLFDTRAYRAAAIALDLLGDLVLAQAQKAISERDSAALFEQPSEAALFARAAGAFAARRDIAANGGAFREDERRRLLALLTPLAESPVAKALEAQLGG